MKLPVGADVVERVLATFFVTVFGLATADGIGWTEWADLGNWKTWATAGLAAAFSLVKSLIALRVGRKSASLAPQVGLAPVSEQGSPL